MARSWFTGELETVATWWRIERVDGIALGFTSHDRDLRFAGLLHCAAPGIVPAAVRLTAALDSDSAEMAGSLTHDAISAADLDAGRFDGAQVSMGLVDWTSLEFASLYSGTIGAVTSEGTGFSAELQSLKSRLALEFTPRTSPTCRAEFCGAGCTLSASAFESEATVTAASLDVGAIATDAPGDPARFAYGTLRWIDGPDVGLVRRIDQVGAGGMLILDRGFDAGAAGRRVALREGCDHTLGTCADRFGNAINFQGEPFLPGNDLLTSYPLGTT